MCISSCYFYCQGGCVQNGCDTTCGLSGSCGVACGSGCGERHVKCNRNLPQPPDLQEL